MKMLYTSFRLLPWKQKSFVTLFLQFLNLKGIVVPKITYSASAYYVQGTTDGSDEIAEFTDFPR